ncbi:DUF805 domain-containing protein [Campylobacter coli]|nr:DUF805 domain-containing protein [Campylobacter coli]ECQ5790273.1 DUF805 domain-containing protein [Campylobacter coli]
MDSLCCAYFIIVSCVPMLAIGARRLYDIGFSG